jgi:hypothetical protein
LRPLTLWGSITKLVRIEEIEGVKMTRRGSIVRIICLVLFTACGANGQQKKPNILVIMTDDVGVWNISAYHRGMMGGRTPNIDRIAKRRSALH